MGQVKEFIGLYLAFLKVAFKTQLEYRGQYFIRILSKVIAWSTGFVTILILLNQFKQIGGWNTYEVLFLYALDVLSYSIAGTFFMGPFGKLPRLIQRGELDQILVRPVNPFLYLLCVKISAGYTSNYVISAAILSVCIYKLKLAMSAGRLLWFLVVILGASLIQAAAFMITAIPAFWLTKCDGMADIFYSDLVRFLRYPLSIYGAGIRFLLTFILPYAFINYYPAQFFLNKEEMISPVFRYLTPVVGGILFFLAYRFWLLGLKAYKSTGS